MSAHDLPHRRRVLVVEDSLVNQKVLTFMLESQGYEVIVAVNGKEGVEKFCEQAFDVVCMDVQMPVMDGLAAARHIRRQETGTGKRSLIIAVTAGVDRETCLQAGMDDHLQKPVRPQLLRSVLEQLSGAV